MQKDSDIVIGIRLRIATRTRAVQNNALQSVAVGFGDNGAKMFNDAPAQCRCRGKERLAGR
jgi:hypothetical protein